MGDIRVLYVNADGLNQEHLPSTDSVQMLSFKTANKELTDTKLAHLIDGADAADEHIHDTRYYRINQAISQTAGAGDAAKPVITDGTGKISTSFIKTAEVNALLSHSALLNLTADDHLQYLRTDGTRDVSGVIKYATLVSITDDKQLTSKKYVDDAILTANLGQEWYDSVLTRIITPPPSPTKGDRYLIDGSLGTPTGVWVGHTNQVATYTGTGYTYQTPSTGTFVPVDNEPTVLYSYSGTAWQSKSFEVTTASTGILKNGVDLQLDPNSAGAGLGFNAGVYNVNVDSVGIEAVSDTLQIKNAGVKAGKIDFGLGAGQVSGVSIPLADAGNYFATDNVEAALQYLGAESLARGTNYTVGTGGVTKGDLVYVSGSDTVMRYSNLTNNNYCIGVAMATASAGAQVKVLGDDVVLSNVLTGATPGTRYYWNGTTVQTAIPSGVGGNVWAVGIAKNATDMSIEVMHVKKNA